MDTSRWSQIKSIEKSGLAKAQEGPARTLEEDASAHFTITHCPKEICKFIPNKSSALGLGRINGPGVNAHHTVQPYIGDNKGKRELYRVYSN